MPLVRAAAVIAFMRLPQFGKADMREPNAMSAYDPKRTFSGGPL
jgi:hypothetical protein